MTHGKMPGDSRFLSTPSARRATGPDRLGVQGFLFLSTPSARRATLRVNRPSRSQQSFLSTPSARRATGMPLRRCSLRPAISIHALREEGDPFLPSNAKPLIWYFYPRPPRGGRRNCCLQIFHLACISIHALREEGDPAWQCFLWSKCISIHALREEGDSRPARSTPTSTHFYPRPPRGGRPRSSSRDFVDALFLSTPSARRATICGLDAMSALAISIHALREEGDGPLTCAFDISSQFLSTPSARRATCHHSCNQLMLLISIHALREEGDGSSSHRPCRCRYFYPRPPRGGRLVTSVALLTSSKFLSTPSARRATSFGARPCAASGYFYPRPPRGGRLRRSGRWPVPDPISIHALREEGDFSRPKCM